MPTIVYLHGFLSSSASQKAKATRTWLAQYRGDWNFLCPDLPSNPEQTQTTLDCLFRQQQLQGTEVGLIGSSLGGFWATYLAQQQSLPTVLINPAVAPQTRFSEFAGRSLQHYYRDEQCILTDTDLRVLEHCDVPRIAEPDLYWLLAQKGDQVIDYRLAERRYAGCRQSIEDFGNHEFSGYERWLPEIADFFQESFSARLNA